MREVWRAASRQRISHLGTPACGGLRQQGGPDVDGESPPAASGCMQRIGIRTPTLQERTLARHREVFFRIRKPSICQAKAFDGSKPSKNLAFLHQARA